MLFLLFGLEKGWSLQKLQHFYPKLFKRSGHLGFHRFDGNAHLDGNFLVFEALKAAELKNGATLWRKSPDGRIYLLLSFVPDEGFSRIRTSMCLLVEAIIGGMQLAFVLPSHINRHIAHAGIEVIFCGGFDVDLTAVFPNFVKDFGYRFLGCFRAIEVAGSEATEGLVLAFEQGFKTGRVALFQGPLEQCVDVEILCSHDVDDFGIPKLIWKISHLHEEYSKLGQTVVFVLVLGPEMFQKCM